MMREKAAEFRERAKECQKAATDRKTRTQLLEAETSWLSLAADKMEKAVSLCQRRNGKKDC
jgi:hypothetical protein